MYNLTQSDIEKYYWYLDKLDFNYLTPVEELPQYVTQKRSGKTIKRPYSKYSITQIAIDKKCNLYYNILNRLWHEAQLDVIWFEKMFGFETMKIIKEMQHDLI